MASLQLVRLQMPLSIPYAILKSSLTLKKKQIVDQEVVLNFKIVLLWSILTTPQINQRIQVSKTILKHSSRIPIKQRCPREIYC